jgi:acetolactate synthase small subunit
MFILRDEKQLENAIKKAKKIHPKVKVLDFGKYMVTGSKGNLYTVVCRKDERTNQKVIACSCLASEKGLPCFHSAVAIAQHIYLAQNRQQALSF